MSRTVTTETVRQVPPLGEPDIFRAVVLLPGVSQPNDLKGRIHLAGGASDETGVRLDDHPLQDPFHLLGLLGAFNVAALERADVRIHHLPAAVAGRLSGVIDLETRAAPEEPSHEVVTGLISSGLTLARSDLPLGVDLLASARVTYLDKVVELLGKGDKIPLYGYTDALVRLGRGWGGGWRAEALGFLTRDRFRESGLAHFTGYEPMRWGESLLGARLTRAGGSWGVRARASVNRASAYLDERPANRSNLVDATRTWRSAALEVARHSSAWEASLGASLDQRRNEQLWIARGLADEIFSPNTPAVYAGAEEQTLIAGFAEFSARLGERWRATLGGRATHTGEAWHPAPRLLLGVRAAESLQLEAALDRRLQFDSQLEEPIEGSISPPLFLLDEPRIADVAAVAADWTPSAMPFGGAGRVRVEAFAKNYSDRTILPELERWEVRDQAPPGFPEFRRITGRSIGATLGGQVALGEDGLVVQGSYTYQQVREDLTDGTFPTSWDAPHALSLFGSMPLFGAWTFNVAYQAHSGRATTPVIARIFAPGYPENIGIIGNSRYLLGARNSIRVAPFHRLDVGGRRSWQARGAEWTISLQVLNLLFRSNPIDYDWWQYFQRLQGGNGLSGGGRSGLPILPSIGLEVRW
jgi:hypothetical protein